MLVGSVSVLRMVVNASAWLAELDGTDDVPVLHALPGDDEMQDFIVIGAGMTAASLAYHASKLLRAGTKMLVLEAREICGGASGRNGGISHPRPTCPFELRTSAEMKEFIADEMGFDRACYSEGLAANLHYDDTLLQPSVSHDDAQHFDPCEEMHCRPGCFSASRSRKDGYVASFWPAKVVKALCHCANSRSCNSIRFVQNCQVYSIDESKASSPSHVVLETSMGRVVGSKIIIATNGYSNALVPSLRPLLRAVTNTVMCSKAPIPPHLRWGDIVTATCGKGADEVYLNLRNDGRLLIGGFRSHQDDYEKEEDASDLGPGDENARSAITNWLKESFPELLGCVENSGGWEYEWKGLIGNTRDGMPLVGAINIPNIMGDESGVGEVKVKSIYVCVGYGGHGMPRCFGLAKALIQSIGGLDIHPIDKEYLERCKVGRFSHCQR